jgi:hypothetical protein
MIKINKTINDIKAYTYLLKFIINNNICYYYGVRYGNIKLNITPVNDLFIKYFSSSKSVKNLLNDNIFPFEIIIHKTFNSIKDACEFEVSFLTKVDAKIRFDFLNQTNNFDNSLPCNKGRKLNQLIKEKMSISQSKWQSSDEYKLYRSKQMKNKWQDIDYKEYMQDRNNKFWNSDRGIEFIKNRKPTWTGLTHSEETKSKMSISAKIHCASIDCKNRAMKRKRYDCIICYKNNLDGGNFNSHMITKHNWSKEECVIFKKDYNILL